MEKANECGYDGTDIVGPLHTDRFHHSFRPLPLGFVRRTGARVGRQGGTNCDNSIRIGCGLDGVG
jgi:hypothetical protein